MNYKDSSLEITIHGALFTPEEQVVAWYHQYGETFMSHLRGSYWGELYDRKTGVRLIWNDHIGDKMVFYTWTREGLQYHTSLVELAQIVRKERELSYDNSFLWSLLTYGYSPVCHTIYDGICRIPAGCYIRVDEFGKWELKIYHRFNNVPNFNSIEENITQFDKLFRQAVQRVLDYNAKNGYTNYMPLSAGLDSRMSCRVAHELTKEPIINVTYSQTGYYDETVPRELTAYWGNEWRFRALDGGDYLMNLDDISRRTHGLINYTGAAQVADSFDRIETDEVGMVLTGMIGDILLNAHYSAKDAYSPYAIGEGAFVHRYERMMSLYLAPELEVRNKELGYIYVRGFNGMNLGSPLIQQERGESYSPFYDVDTLEFIFSIPMGQRRNYRIYDQWILSHYPDMVRWLHNGRERIGHRPKQVSILGRLISLPNLPKRICWYLLKKLHIKDMYTLDATNSMNPEDMWIATNSRLREFVNQYISENIDRISDAELKKAAEELNSGTFMERSQVLTLLAALKNFSL